METKKRGGRPRFEPTKEQREIVKVMAGHNIHQDKICAAFGITEKTLRKHFKAELISAAAMVEASLVSGMFGRAKGKDGTAQRAAEFLLQTRFGWSRYAPEQPQTAKDVPLGKKEQQNIDAENGHKETSWADLVH